MSNRPGASPIDTGPLVYSIPVVVELFRGQHDVEASEHDGFPFHGGLLEENRRAVFFVNFRFALEHDVGIEILPAVLVHLDPNVRSAAIITFRHD